MGKKRTIIQALSAILCNANIKGFFTGQIYTGATKSVCVPGLNCYSCPGAVGACPIGSLQTFLTGLKFKVPYYVVGLLIFFGAVLGRAVCGFLCPFGFLQDILFKIPFFKKNRFKGDRILRYLKYVILALFVIILPFTFKLTPFFCKYICPSGTIAGLLLSAADPRVRPMLGNLFEQKLVILGIILSASLIVWRPFCKYLCPLGAIYGFFNKAALYRMDLSKDKCISCGKCAGVCNMNIDPSRTPNSMECIRCGECVKACPAGALVCGFIRQDASQKKSEEVV
ncbi:MAG: 4Fe-4S binding protein [Clostridiales bacterium]|nr:4Fe-4S binding protein [Clostridiales bacterium]